MKRTKLDDRILPVYTKGEEIFNMVTHIVGGAMGIVALVLCIIFCHDGYGLFSGIVYGISMILLYTMSAIYHGLSPKLKAKKVFQIMDHCSIFVLFSGSLSLNNFLARSSCLSRIVLWYSIIFLEKVTMIY